MLTDKMHVVHPRAAGLDVHKMEITATVRLCPPEGGEPETGTRVFSTLESGMRDLVAWLLDHGVTAAAMEATGIYWEVPALEDAGLLVELLHAQHVKQIKGRKTDVADSMWLARICQFGLATPSLVLPREFRRLRVLSRHRRRMIDDCARLRNRIHKVLDRDGIRLGGVLSDVFGVNGYRILRGIISEEAREDIVASLSRHVAAKRRTLEEVLACDLGPYSRQILSDLLDCHEFSNKKVAHYDKLIREGLKDFEQEIFLLQTIPGIDQESACAILLGPDIGVSACRCAAWSGVCPGNNRSAGKHGRSRKGNPMLRKVLVECAHGAARTDHCQGYHKALQVRCGYKRAIVATAHKLLRVIYSVLRDRKPYRDPETDYEAMMRNAPRWIRMLKMYNIVEQDNEGRMRVKPQPASRAA